MNTEKTLLAILVEELPKNGGWPGECRAITQDSDRQINIYTADDGLETSEYGTWKYSSNWHDWLEIEGGLPCLAIDHATAIITRDQYEAALAASQAPASDADGWIEWAGGECPVDGDALVDVKHWSGEEYFNQPAKTYGDWSHIGEKGDIIAYRLHQPEDADKIVGPGGGYIWNPDANSRANDDRLEADLNDCIGQAPVQVPVPERWTMLADIHAAGIIIDLETAVYLADFLVDAGYRKQ